MIEITIATKSGPQVIKAHKSACDNLFIHRPAEGGKTWVISHIPSGYKILGSIESLENARRACEIFAQIKAWDNLTPDKARKFFDENYTILAAGRDAAYKDQTSVGH